jgi:hypothetical protein
MVVALLAALAVVAPQAASAGQHAIYVGWYLQDQKIGYQTYLSKPDTLKGRTVLKATTTADLWMEGRRTHCVSVVYSEPTGHPIQMICDESSRETNLHEELSFGRDTIDFKSEVNGKLTEKKLPLPTDGVVVDPIAPVFPFDGSKLGSSVKVYVPSPLQMNLLEQANVFAGKTTVDVRGRSFTANRVVMKGQGQDSEIYCSDSGDLIEQKLNDRQELVVETKETVLSGISKDVELSDFLVIATIPNMPNPSEIRELKLAVKVDKVDALPSDDHQTAIKTPDGWLLDVHPQSVFADPRSTIAYAAGLQPDWLKPDEKILCNDSRFVKLAKEIVGRETDIRNAVAKIQDYVSKRMRYDEDTLSGSSQRNAFEIWKSGRGVCGDYSLLSATLLRAAGIPTRLAWGLVTSDSAHGDLDPHCWVSIFDGTHWVDIESMQAGIVETSPGYIELGGGGYAQWTGEPLDQFFKATFTVVSSQ